ncbi:MAG: SH3 domain-containing protein, partial [Caldilineaceae bacterium]|nr:SH3 domain-containing protein [Caldilineaceae bacterium]
MPVTFSPLPTPTNTATPTPTPITLGGIVNRNANLRAGPGIGHAKIGLARAGTPVTIMGTNTAGDWYYLATGEWVAAFLVDKSSELPLAVVVEGQSISLRQSTPSGTTVQAATATPTQAASLDCRRPPDDMTLVQVNGETVSMRTYWMLQLAQDIYGGPGSVLRVVQGSYEPGLTESFG